MKALIELINELFYFSRIGEVPGKKVSFKRSGEKEGGDKTFITCEISVCFKWEQLHLKALNLSFVVNHSHLQLH